MEVKVRRSWASYSLVSLGDYSAIYLRDILELKSRVLGVPISFSPLFYLHLAHRILSLQEPRVKRVDQNIPEAPTPSTSHLYLSLVNLSAEMDSSLGDGLLPCP